MGWSWSQPSNPCENREKEQTIEERIAEAKALVVGNYCHDLIRLACGREVESLGGSVSYITRIMDSMEIPCKVISKVGSDFKYKKKVAERYLPLELPEPAKTTSFYADFASAASKDRVLRLHNACDPIYADEISGLAKETDLYEVGLAVGVAGEIKAETLARMARVSRVLVADIQALIRTVDPADGSVRLRHLRETPFWDIVMQGRVAYIKASSSEAPFIDVEEVRQKVVVIVTEGSRGCNVYQDEREFHVGAFRAQEIDPTGAGDSFLAGLCAGLIKGFSLEQAVRLGNFFGAAAVSHIGVPSSQTLKELLNKTFKLGVSDINFDPATPCTISVAGTEGLDWNNEQNLEEIAENCVQNGIDNGKHWSH